MAHEVASAYVSLIPSFRGGTRGIANALGGAPDQAGRDSGRRFGTGFLSTVKGVVAGAAVYQGLGAAAGFAKNAIFGFNSTLQQSKIAFTTMLGSGKAAQSFIDQLASFAKRTPFEFQGLVKNSQLLMGMGVAAKDVIPDLTALGDSTASVGGNADELNNTILAFGQTVSKGKLSMDNMNQLLQGGVPTALKVLAAQFHVTTGRMVEMISTGKVQSSVALPLLIQGLEKGTKSTAALGGMMDKQSTTFAGSLSNIGDALTQSLAHAFLPFFNTVSTGAQGLASWLSGPRFSAISAGLTHGLTAGMHGAGQAIQFVEPIAKRVFNSVLVPAFNTIRDVVPKVVTTVRNLWDVVKPLAVTVGNGLVGAFHALLPVVRDVGSALKSASQWAKDHATLVRTLVVVVGTAVAVWQAWKLGVAAWAAVTKIATGVQAAFNVVMDANPILLVVTALAALAAGFVYAYQHSALFRRIVEAAFNGVKTAAKAVANFFTVDIPKAFHAVVDGLHSAWNAVVGFMKTWGPRALLILAPFIGIPLLIYRHFGQIVGWLRGVWHTVTKDVGSAIGTVVGFVTSLPRRIIALNGMMLSAGLGLIKSLFKGLGQALGKAASFAADVGRSIANGVIGFINRNVIDPLRGFSFTVGAFGVHHTFQPFGSLPEIPALAQGGIVPATPGGRLVRVAEAGQAEAVIPLDKLKSFANGGTDRAAPLVGELNIHEVSDPVGTARATVRRLQALGA